MAVLHYFNLSNCLFLFDHINSRQMAARTLHEAMRAVVDEEDCKRMLIVLQKLADDTGTDANPTIGNSIDYIPLQLLSFH